MYAEGESLFILTGIISAYVSSNDRRTFTDKTDTHVTLT